MQAVYSRDELAGMTTRFVALAIDTIILGVIGGMLIGGGRAVGGIIGFVIGAAYQWFFLTRNNGQTPGKLLMGIRVVKTNGQPISDAEAILRYVGYYVNTAVFMLGWLWALIDGQRRGLHDYFVGTMVVRK